MFELDNLQKSSDPVTGLDQQHPIEISQPSIYFDREQALREFDRETEQNQKKEFKSPLDKSLSGLVANAQVLIRHQEYPLALNLLRTASNQDSKNVLVLSLIAECLEALQKFDESQKVRQVLVSLDCSFEQLHKFATLLYKRGQDEAALGKYYEALSMLTDEDQALFEIYKNMGNILVRQGDFESAEDFYNKAYTLNPKSDTLLVNFATLEVQRQDSDKALYCFRQAVEANRKNDKAWVGLAMIHSQFGDHDLAWANLETALDINPINRTAVHLLANWSLRDKRTSQGIAVLENYLGSVDFDEDMSLVLINLYCGGSQIQEAQLECERVLLWNPKNEDVVSLRSQLKKIKKV